MSFNVDKHLILDRHMPLPWHRGSLHVSGRHLIGYPQLSWQPMVVLGHWHPWGIFFAAEFQRVDYTETALKWGVGGAVFGHYRSKEA